MATYEGKWRCPRCANANLGRFLNCQTCGSKRDDNVRFFLDEDNSVVTDESLLRQARAGADWVCQYCAGNNRAFDQNCTSCGAARTAENKQLQEETRGANDWTEAMQRAAFLNSQNQPPKKSFFANRLLKIALLCTGAFAGLFVFLFAALVYISTLEYSRELEVVGLEWQRTIKIEEYKTVRETAWEGEVPDEARIQSKETAQHHTDRVPNGTRQVPESYTERVADGTERYVCGRKNKKNGYFEDEYCTRTKYKEVTKTRNRTETVYKDVPVYRTRYTYLIDKWVAAGEKTTAGNDFDPQWATVQIDNVRTREGGREESYNLLCKELGGDNKLYKYKVEADAWSRFQNGMRLHGKTDFFGELISIDELANRNW
jgi:hypothetical protein